MSDSTDSTDLRQFSQYPQSDQNVSDSKSGRAPKPAALTWSQMKDKQPGLGSTTSGTSKDIGGCISPVSSSEVLRTPNQDTRFIRHPSSPESSSQLPPRLHSPASQIFERSVQEDIVSAQASPSIPAHIRTENYIPPVLEASSAAITDDHLDPDSVEIVTHSLHQPAGVPSAEQSMSSSSIDAHHLSDMEDISSSYGALDTADVRRLSFISFADVVNAEHAETNEVHTSVPIRERGINRSPSPLRSPSSSHGFGTSPPTSIATSFTGFDMPPTRLPTVNSAQSPVSSSFGGDLNVETMRQALRRTGSGDLGGVTSQAVSTIGIDDVSDRTF
ncbi:hypothetical protein N7499_004831 [Penicillium canescens]|uniref:Uncharacterized protein n=1 Tax=Penicillium canescens TaxID=5083 RepID=A0AAD6I0U4_PENCN|nr:uncharacterized protein N7446_004666 [Penicillium canescens]KAJ6009769.1 hypothetical protein N7522_004785 [Penicillium canescens]KAJ6026732.1 hypothetical protein N7460_011549 [Penicillium canescens]KAJ6040015.1 hypothetical protein N7444_008920 [Penicillium canescens]KAJ6067629.1 hypothetical protein N7446_004666 [Penicillium canescens]KAJ6085202.1 hypothetical protein N7499_004831 [Penicillium canescens]